MKSGFYRQALLLLLLAPLTAPAAGGGGAAATPPPAPAPPPPPPARVEPPKAPSAPSSSGLSPKAPALPKAKASMWARICAMSPLKQSVDRLNDKVQSSITADTKAVSGSVSADADQHYANTVVLGVFASSFGKFSVEPDEKKLPEKAPEGGSVKIKAAYENFGRAGKQFLADFNPGGRVYPLMIKCTSQTAGLGNPEGAFAHQITLTKVFLLSRHNFTTEANAAMTQDHGSAAPLVSTGLSDHNSLAEQDVLCCPADSWKQAKKKFLYRPTSNTGQGKCAPEELAQYQKLASDAFDSLIKPLGGEQSCGRARRGNLNGE